MKIQILACFISTLATSIPCLAQTPHDSVTVDSGVSIVNDDHSSGLDESLRVNGRLFHDHLIYAEFDQTSRSFYGQSIMTDQSTTAGHVSRITSHTYIEDAISVAPQANFLPQTAFATVPHYTLQGGWDLSLGLKFAHYSLDDVGTISPALVYELNGEWMFGAQVNVVRTTHFISSEQGFAQYRVNDNQKARLTLAKGRAVEGPDLEGDFNALALGYRWRVFRDWAIEPIFSDYRGTVRNELAWGLNLHWGQP